MATKVAFEGKRELRWMTIDTCLVTYMEADTDFGDDLWDQWLDAVRRPSVRSLMIGSWGPTKPSHQQWRRATRLMRERELPVAVVTEARHNLALAKAASWLGTNIESHRWGNLDAAVKLVGLGQQSIMAKATIIALRDRFGAVVSPAAVAEPELLRPAARPSLAFESDDASTAMVIENSEEIQRRLAEVQARFRKTSGPVVAAKKTGS